LGETLKLGIGVVLVTPRERMLALIRERQLKPRERGADEIEAVRAHVASHSTGPAPRDEWPPLPRFRERALSLASTLDPVPSITDGPARAAAYLRERELPLRAVCWRELLELDWQGSGIEVEGRAARGDDLIGITGAYCAIAETGTLMTLTGPDTPASASLLPETHIAIVDSTRVVPNMEAAWQLVRREGRRMPRAVNFISGPSRTADIEQTVTLGAHGPYRVHIILVGTGI
jgi:L-lactate dehydrogenase complex protein LldG